MLYGFGGYCFFHFFSQPVFCCTRAKVCRLVEEIKKFISYAYKVLLKKNITQTNDKFDKLWDSASSIWMVKRWFTEFRCGLTTTSNAECFLCQILWKCWRCDTDRLEMEIARDHSTYKRITLNSGLGFERTLGHGEAICKMGSVFAHIWPKKHSCDNFKGVFILV